MVYLAERTDNFGNRKVNSVEVVRNRQNEDSGLLNYEGQEFPEQSFGSMDAHNVAIPQDWALLDSVPVGLLVLDNRGVVVFANSEANRIMGESVQEKTWLDVITQFFTPKGDDGYDLTLKNGRRIKLNTKPYNQGKSQLISLIDISDTRYYQERINHEERIYQMGEMASNLAHQIRTPLSSALIYSNLLLAEPQQAQESEKYKLKIIDGLKRIENQVKDVLLYSRRETLLNEQVDLAQLLDSIRSEYLDLEHSHHLRVELKVADDGSTPLLRGNRSALHGAFTNLINNAMEAQSTNCLVSISLITKNKKIILVIEDNGPGVSCGDPQKLLEPFFTTKSNGTGLGLSVVKSVITAHGGELFLSKSSLGGLKVCMEFKHD